MTRQGALLTPPNNALLRRQNEVLNAAQVLEPRHSGIRLWPISQLTAIGKMPGSFTPLTMASQALGDTPDPSPIKVLRSLTDLRTA